MKHYIQMLLNRMLKNKKVANVIDKTNFQFKVIKFTNDFMCKYGLNMLREKNQATNVSPSNTWNFFKSVPFFALLI